MKLQLMVYFLAMLPLLSRAQTLPPAFVSCPSTGFQVVDNPTKFQIVNLATGATTTVATFPIYVNAMGYNPNDNRIYGVKLMAPLGLVAIGSDYTYRLIATSGNPMESATTGDVNAAGILWGLNGTTVFTVNCNSSDPVNFGLVTSLNRRPAVTITDWSFPPNDNTKIYAVNSDGALIYISTADLSVNTVMPNSTVPSAAYGASYFDNSGNFYAKNNVSGVIYKFINATSSTPTVIAFSTSSASSQNDGARCPIAAAPVIGDYGDAPASFGTYASGTGPCHQLPSPDSSLAQLYLGTAVSIDEDGEPSAGSNLDADDGVTSFPAIGGGLGGYVIASYSVPVAVRNAIATTANLAAWIDWNSNGTFDAGERMDAPVESNFTGTKILTWTNVTLNGMLGTAGTYARFRVSTDALTGPGGTVANGEVEDYYIPFTTILPVLITSFTAIKSDASINLSWSTASEQNNKGFSIERGTNGILFRQIAFVPSQAIEGTASQKINYHFKDTRPLEGTNYYRLKQADLDDQAVFSIVLKQTFINQGTLISFYPNPARDQITINGLKGNESILLYNFKDQLIKKSTANGAILKLNVGNIRPGVYRLTVTDPSGRSTSQKIVKQ